MGGTLSSLSKHFLTTAALSAGLPAAVFVLLVALLIVPLLPEGSVPSERLEALGPEWKTVIGTGATLLVAAILVNLNIPIIRLFEGYPWRESCIGKIMTWRRRRQFRWRDRYWWAVRAVLLELPKGSEQFEPLKRKWDEVAEELVASYPSSEERVLPTRLGNVIRSFEDYSGEKYGIRAIPSWPRLVAVIPEKYARVIQEEKSALDFMLNGAVLSGVLSLMLLLAGLTWPASLHEAGALVVWSGQVVLFVGGIYVFYNLGITRAAAWGVTVKSAFDLYRFDLLKALGFELMPPNQQDEKALWGQICGHLAFGRLSTEYPLGYSPPWAEGSFRDSLVVSRRLTGDEKAVLLVVRNEGKRRVEEIKVVERVEGELLGEPVFENTGRPVPHWGANPYTLSVGSLDPKEEVAVRYLVRRAKAESPS